MKKFLYPILSTVLITSYLVSGCSVLGSKKLENAYSFEQYEEIFENTEEKDYVTLFSSDLCVINDEDAYNAGDLTSESAALFNITDQEVVYSKNAFEQRYPASITKVMTALIALKYGDLSSKVTVTEDAMVTEPGSSLAHIKPGETYTLEQLLYGLMIPSGNDAGSAIAIHMAGNIREFSEMMDQEAAKLGASSTHFKNPHGLTEEGHTTTAYDLYLIFNEALKYPEFRKIISTYSYTLDYQDQDGNDATRTWSGGSWYMSGDEKTPEGLQVIGGKTGTTNAAGYCLIMLTKDQQDKEYISVVLKADSRPSLYDNMTTLIKKILDL